MSFVEFIQTEERIDPDFLARLSASGNAIESLPSLLRFARERWPGNYPKDLCKATTNMPFGREAMAALWSQYLKARESK